MKTPIDLLDPLMGRIKIRAATEGRKLMDLISELLEKGLDSPPQPAVTKGEHPYVIDPKTGMAMARTLNIPGFVPPTAGESRAMIESAKEEEDLRRAGLVP